MNNEGLGILLEAKLDLQKTIANVNADLKKLASQVQALNLNIDTSNLTKNINQQISKINKNGKTEIVVDTNLDELPKEITDVSKFVDNLKKQFNVSSASIKRDVQLSTNEMKSLLVTLKQVDGVTRSIRLTPTGDSTPQATKYRPDFLTVNDKREEQALKIAKDRIAIINKQREEADKLFGIEQKKTRELNEQLEIERRMAAIRVQDLRRRYSPVLTPEQNKQLDDYVQNMNNLRATTPNVSHEMKRLNTDFKEISANVAEAGSRTDSFGKQLGVAMSRIPIWIDN